MGILVGLVGFWLRQNTKLSIVEISAWLTLGAGLILPRLGSDGFLLGLICTSVSYVVMSSRERISTRKEMVIVSATCALVVYYGQNVLVGIGGRLGTFAALSVLFFNLARDYLKRRYDHDYGNHYS
jgi:ABC-type Co2+ transport system permease subunit